MKKIIAPAAKADKSRGYKGGCALAAAINELPPQTINTLRLLRLTHEVGSGLEIKFKKKTKFRPNTASFTLLAFAVSSVILFCTTSSVRLGLAVHPPTLILRYSVSPYSNSKLKGCLLSQQIN